MTEKEFFIEVAPSIAEILVYCRKLSEEEYANYKQETLATIDPRSVPFIKKVFILIEKLM